MSWMFATDARLHRERAIHPIPPYGGTRELSKSGWARLAWITVRMEPTFRARFPDGQGCTRRASRPRGNGIMGAYSLMPVVTPSSGHLRAADAAFSGAKSLPAAASASAVRPGRVSRVSRTSSAAASRQARHGFMTV